MGELENLKKENEELKKQLEVINAKYPHLN